MKDSLDVWYGENPDDAAGPTKEDAIKKKMPRKSAGGKDDDQRASWTREKDDIFDSLISKEDYGAEGGSKNVHDIPGEAEGESGDVLNILDSEKT